MSSLLCLHLSRPERPLHWKGQEGTRRRDGDHLKSEQEHQKESWGTLEGTSGSTAPHNGGDGHNASKREREGGREEAQIKTASR